MFFIRLFLANTQISHCQNSYLLLEISVLKTTKDRSFSLILSQGVVFQVDLGITKLAGAQV